MSLERATGADWEAWIFQDVSVRESLCLPEEGLWVIGSCGSRRGMAAQRWVAWLKAERARWSWGPLRNSIGARAGIVTVTGVLSVGPCVLVGRGDFLISFYFHMLGCSMYKRHRHRPQTRPKAQPILVLPTNIIKPRKN
jgi:hypothetical protein